MFQVNAPTKADCEYTLNTIIASYLFRCAAIEDKRGNEWGAKIYFARARFHTIVANAVRGEIESSHHLNVHCYLMWAESKFDENVFNSICHQLGMGQYPLKVKS